MTFLEMRNIQSLNETKSWKYNLYFRAKQTPRNTSVVAPPQFRKQYFTAVPICRLACQVLSERIDLDSWFTTDEDDKADAFLVSTLKVNGGSDFVASAHISAMEYGRAYVVPTGSLRSDGFPMLSVVPGANMVHRIDAYTGELIEALEVFGVNKDRFVYWTPGTRWTLIKKPEPWDATVIIPDEGFRESITFPGFWEQVDTFEGRIPVFPIMCRGEPGNTFGRPECKDIFDAQDAACRYATDMAIASALMGTPKEFLFGAEASDFAEKGPDGKPIPGTTPDTSELYMSRFITISDPAVKLAQAQAAQLQNFATASNTILRQAAATMGLPMSVFGIASDSNPASGDSKAEDDKRLVRRSEQLARGFEPGWVDLGTYLLEQYGFGTHPVAVRWSDPSLPNLAGRADAVLKLSQMKDASGIPVYTWQELRRKLGDSDEEIQAAEAERELVSVQRLLDQPTQNAGANEQGASPQSGG